MDKSKEVFVNPFGLLCRTYKTNGANPRGLYTVIDVEPTKEFKRVRMAINKSL